MRNSAYLTQVKQHKRYIDKEEFLAKLEQESFVNVAPMANRQKDFTGHPVYSSNVFNFSAPQLPPVNNRYNPQPHFEESFQRYNSLPAINETSLDDKPFFGRKKLFIYQDNIPLNKKEKDFRYQQELQKQIEEKKKLQDQKDRERERQLAYWYKDQEEPRQQQPDINHQPQQNYQAQPQNHYQQQKPTITHYQSQPTISYQHYQKPNHVESRANELEQNRHIAHSTKIPHLPAIKHVEVDDLIHRIDLARVKGVSGVEKLTETVNQVIKSLETKKNTFTKRTDHKTNETTKKPATFKKPESVKENPKVGFISSKEFSKIKTGLPKPKELKQIPKQKQEFVKNAFKQTPTTSANQPEDVRSFKTAETQQTRSFKPTETQQPKASSQPVVQNSFQKLDEHTRKELSDALKSLQIAINQEATRIEQERLVF